MRIICLTTIQILLLLFLAGCRQAEGPATVMATVAPTLVAPSATPSPVPPTSTPVLVELSRNIASSEQFVAVEVDVQRGIHPISPLIYGLSGATEEHIKQLRPTLNSWGGNPSTRYNWELGNAWNAGSDWFYRNGNYGYTGESASDDFVDQFSRIKWITFRLTKSGGRYSRVFAVG